MNEHLLEYVACAVLLVPLAVCAVCISVGSLWAIAFIIKAVGAVNRIGALRNGRSKCPDLGYRLMSSRTPVTVKLLLLLRAYTHHDKHVRRFGEDALRYDGKSIFWTLTSVLVKTGLDGKFVSKYEINRVDGHMGDLCCHGGRVFVGMAMGEVDGCRVGDEVWEFDNASLQLLKRHPTPQTAWSNNGIEFYAGSFWIASSSPRHCRYNMVFRYTPDFRFMRCQMIDSGWTNRGAQTIFQRKGKMLLGCYGCPDDKDQPHGSCTLVVDGDALASANESGKTSAIVRRRRRPMRPDG